MELGVMLFYKAAIKYKLDRILANNDKKIGDMANDDLQNWPTDCYQTTLANFILAEAFTPFKLQLETSWRSRLPISKKTLKSKGKDFLNTSPIVT